MRASRDILKERGLQTQGLTIRTKLTLSLLPVVLLSLVVLTWVTTFLNQETILKKSDEQMKAVLGDYANQLAGDLDTIKNETRDLSNFVGSSYEVSDINIYKETITRIVESNDMILGSGLWFEPNVFIPTRQFYGPYWYKSINSKGLWDKNQLLESWMYSNADYDYFSQGYYINAKEANAGSVLVTEPYFDEPSGLVMVTCSAPIYSKDNKFLGCVTIDVMLTQIEAMFSSVSIEETGRMWLLDGNNRYLYYPDFENVAIQNITFTDTKELSSQFDITSHESGQRRLTIDNKPVLAYWMTVPNTTWKLGLTIDEAEVFKDSQRLIVAGIIICVISIIFCGVMIVLHAYYFSRAAKSIAETISDISEGHFHKINKYANKTDEFGVMIKSTNLLVEKISAAADDMQRSADVVTDASENLSDKSAILSDAATAANTVSRTISDGIITRKEKMDVVVNKFDALSRQLDFLSIAINKAKSDAYIEAAPEINIDISIFDDVKKALSELSKEISGIARSLQNSDDLMLSVNENLDNLSSNLTQTNLLALKSSAKAARFGDFGATTVALIDEISKISANSADIVYHTRDKVSQMDSYIDDVNMKLVSLSKIDSSVDKALSKIPETISAPKAPSNTVNLNNVLNSMRLCDRACTETRAAMTELMALYDNNVSVMKKSENMVKDLSDAVEVIDTSTNMLHESIADLEEKIAFFKS